MSAGQPQLESREGRVAPPSGGAPGLPSLKKDNCIRRYRFKPVFVAQENIRLYIEKFGERNVGVLTVTTPSACLLAAEFQRMWHSFQSNVLKELFPTGMWNRERQPRSGNWHAHPSSTSAGTLRQVSLSMRSKLASTRMWMPVFGRFGRSCGREVAHAVSDALNCFPSNIPALPAPATSQSIWAKPLVRRKQRGKRNAGCSESGAVSASFIRSSASFPRASSDGNWHG